MPAEGMPHDASMFARPLAWVSRHALAAPRRAILLGVLLAGVALVISGLGLGFRTSRLDLLNPDSEWNQRWIAYLDAFGREDDAVVVVEGADPAAVQATIDDLAGELTDHDQYFSSVFARVELGRLRAKGLHLLPADQLARLEGFAANAEPILRGEWQNLTLSSQLQRIAQALEFLPPDAPQRQPLVEQLDRLLTGMQGALADPGEYRTPWPIDQAAMQEADTLADRYLVADDGRLGMVLVKLVPESGTPRDEDHHQSLTKLRELLKTVEARHENVTLGVTGMPVLEHDEMHTSQRDMTWTSLLSSLGVAACFWAAFGGWRHAALAMAALAVSMCWAFGYVTLAVGHLNLLSVSFASVLIGQGIDFGVHYVAGYLRARHENMNCVDALTHTSSTVGPGILTGGLTTSIAFCMALLTDFTGLRELGMIAGGGILICTVGALLLLPPLIRCSDEGRQTQKLPQIVPMQFLTWPMHRLPWLTIVLLVGFTTFCGVGLLRLRYDHNLLNLQSQGLESVMLEHTLIERADRSVWFALSMCGTREELLARKKQFEALATVSHTEEIASLLSDDTPAREQSLSNVRRVIALTPEQPPQLLAADPVLIAQSLAQIHACLPNSPELGDMARQLVASPPGVVAHRLSNYQQQAAVELVDRLRQLREHADPAPPRVEDLPRALTDRYIGAQGQFLLKVYAAGDVWDIDRLTQFVRDTESVDAQITGHPIQTFYASSQMQRSYLHAGIYAFLAMLIAVIIDLRRLRPSLLAVVPMFMGLVQTFGLLGWLGIPLNAANMIVLPLIFGIGIDDGVHLLHDFFHQRRRYRLDNATFVAVLLTSVTTMVGFGSLILAQHQGLRSLGQVLTLGVLCCLISSTSLLPALFVIWTAKREPEEVPEPAPRTPPCPVGEPAAPALRIDGAAADAAERLVATRQPSRIVPRRTA